MTASNESSRQTSLNVDIKGSRRCTPAALALGTVATALAITLVAVLILPPHSSTSSGVNLPVTETPLVLINGTLYREMYVTVQLGNPPPPQSDAFGNASFVLWIAGWGGPGGPSLDGNVTERATLYHFTLSSLSTSLHWVAPGHDIGVLWTGQQDVYLLSRY